MGTSRCGGGSDLIQLKYVTELKELINEDWTNLKSVEVGVRESLKKKLVRSRLK